MSLGPLGANCYLIHNNQEALIIDPGGESEVIKEAIQRRNVKPLAIILTHAHFDHIGAVEEIRLQYDIEVYVHENEADWLSESRLNRSLLFTGENIVTSPPDKFLEIGIMEIGPFQFEIIHTPGHSPGSVSIAFHDEKKVLSGDALFYQGIGRTDLPGGNAEELENSIKDNLYTLDDIYTVYPGHGPSTTIGAEKRNNPFVYIR